MQDHGLKNVTPINLTDEQHPLEKAVFNASAELTLYEKRLILLAIHKEKGKAISSESCITIEASEYTEAFGGDMRSAYNELRIACNTIFERDFSYYARSPSNNLMFCRSRWVSKIGYTDTEQSVLLHFTPSIISILNNLEKKISSTNHEKINLLSNKYAICLYDVLCQFKNLGKLTIGINELREIFSLETNTYRSISSLKKHVLDLSIKQINTQTDLNVSYTQQEAEIQLFTFNIK